MGDYPNVGCHLTSPTLSHVANLVAHAMRYTVYKYHRLFPSEGFNLSVHSRVDNDRPYPSTYCECHPYVGA
jgi:hypothetical protein